MFAFELSQADIRAQSPVGRLADLPIEDDYSEESFPDEDRDGDLAWRAQEAVAASELRKWAKRPYREPGCVVQNA
ncbi:MAG: hypothetical protein IT165_06065 [Bryobacterales bacterium]|nr:hypothetical protein [Bryobacterales bacterium]